MRAICGNNTKNLRFADPAHGLPLHVPDRSALIAPSCDEVVNQGVVEVVSAVATPPRAKRSKKVTCEECFFSRNGLCALEVDEPCATFRPDHPDGLRPPTQMRFVFRQERRRQSAWAFPSADEQAALHG